MAQMTFAVSPDGLAVPTLIGLSQPAMRQLNLAGMTIPRPTRCRAIVDTGSDITCVSAAIIGGLGIAAKANASTQTVSGPSSVRLFDVSLSIPAPSPANMVVMPIVTVMELPQTIPNFDVILGLDVILQTRFFIDGPGQSFTIDF
jgi:hypothetical protein